MLCLRVLSLSDHLLKPHYRVCSKHFCDGDPNNGHELYLGKKFAVLVKSYTALLHVYNEEHDVSKEEGFAGITGSVIIIKNGNHIICPHYHL